MSPQMPFSAAAASPRTIKVHPADNDAFVVSDSGPPLAEAIPRRGFSKNFCVDDVSLPNGVRLSDAGYCNSLIAGSFVNDSLPIGMITTAASTPVVSAITGVRLKDCDFGTLAAAGSVSATVAGPIYALNAIDLGNVCIAGNNLKATASGLR